MSHAGFRSAHRPGFSGRPGSSHRPGRSHRRSVVLGAVVGVVCSLLAALVLQDPTPGSGDLALERADAATEVHPLAVEPSADAVAASDSVGTLPVTEAAPPSASPAAAEPRPHIDHPALQAELHTIVSSTLPDVGVVTVSVTTDDGEPVYDHQASMPVVPASTEKNVVAAAALRVFGPAHRYRTRVFATEPPDAAGVLHGTLVVVGSGDPTLGTDLYGSVTPDRPRTPLEGLADQIAGTGIRHVAGGILGDPRVFADQPTGPGWKPSYLGAGHASPVTGLTVDGGRRVFLTDRGVRSVPAADPSAHAADTLRWLLTARGVAVGGPIGTSLDPPPAPVPVAEVVSPPLEEILRYMVQRSDNRIADAVFRTLGAAAGDSSWGGSGRVAHDALADLPLRWAGVRIVDGSGLSTENRLTAAFLSDLDTAMFASELGPTWLNLKAVAGGTGTLTRRMAGTIAQGRVWGKTGTLDGVRALAATVIGPVDAQYHFAVIGNGLPPRAARQLRVLQDRVAVALAHDLERCAQTAPPPAGFRCAA